MNKQDLIDFVADAAKLTKKDAALAIDAVFIGFGSFKVQKSAARKARNPRTGEEINVAASNRPTFKAGKELKEAVNS
jgi:DNA-binding protein HU-beta